MPIYFTRIYSSEHPVLLGWYVKYVASFDFIVNNDDGQVYAIECNPRVHSAITTFYNHSNIVDGYFRPSPFTSMIPLSTDH